VFACLLSAVLEASRKPVSLSEGLGNTQRGSRFWSEAREGLSGAENACFGMPPPVVQRLGLSGKTIKGIILVARDASRTLDPQRAGDPLCRTKAGEQAMTTDFDS